MPPITFSHPQVSGTLTVDTGANDIAWAYTLNTSTYPTYAGEVVQVLSTSIENLNISGEVRSVAEMERIYHWFLQYMQIATQGRDGTNYSEYAVKMDYPERGWTLYIQPIALPGLHYGRDVVVPTWQVQAHVLDPDPKMTELTIDAALNPELDQFKNALTADIGFREYNPYSDPLGVLTHDEAVLFPDHHQRYQGMDASKDAAREDLTGIAKRLAGLVEAYVGGDFSGITDIMETYGIEGSKPSDKQDPKKPQTADTEKSGGKKGNG
jgi:hypothetical protein